ncbi:MULTISPECIES: hypothetical protein [unclassified Neisseria]|uniref:hypothetical protein n=1 Tax=unclassified Neisseria TaxID=2623750 RepID=UPI0010721799|nr:MULTISPECIES: hypothetical protein [unclassified Neisseria]MBF0803516.1 hypothetical protein [Neisseria sp. 19428wB4_WF04]TFU43798.1 hypothetical protein E4T99_03965 [Neisseria sp. WF04]
MTHLNHRVGLPFLNMRGGIRAVADKRCRPSEKSRRRRSGKAADGVQAGCMICNGFGAAALENPKIRPQ